MSILESLQHNPLDALKYGPIALAALSALWVSALLSIELNRTTVRKSARSLLVIFMGFCFVLTAVSWGLFLYDAKAQQKLVTENDAQVAQIRKDYDIRLSKLENDQREKVASLENEKRGLTSNHNAQMEKIRQLIVRVDSEAINKMRVEYNPAGLDRNALRMISRSLCSAVTDIYRVAGGFQPTNTCAAVQNNPL